MAKPNKFTGRDPSKLCPFIVSCIMAFNSWPRKFATDDRDVLTQCRTSPTSPCCGATDSESHFTETVHSTMIGVSLSISEHLLQAADLARLRNVPFAHQNAGYQACQHQYMT